jgi:hypothetical protein
MWLNEIAIPVSPLGRHDPLHVGATHLREAMRGEGAIPLVNSSPFPTRCVHQANDRMHLHRCVGDRFQERLPLSPLLLRDAPVDVRREADVW